MSTWVKVYNSLPAHPKVLQLDDAAFRLFICGLCYANEQLTDGFIPRYALETAAPRVKRAARAAAQLVAVGLWYETETGWQIHDYIEHQRSAEKVKGLRKREAARKARTRANAESDPDSRGVSRADSATESDPESGAHRLRGQRAEEKTNTDTASVPLAAVVKELFDYWRDRCQHPTAKLTAERRRKVEARLKEGYTADQIRKAIDGAARAAFVSDQGKRYDDLELICRNGSKLESFIDRADGGTARASSTGGPRPAGPSWQAGALVHETPLADDLRERSERELAEIMERDAGQDHSGWLGTTEGEAA